MVDQHEKKLKDHVDQIVRKCIANNYHTGPMGYLVMVGGEALNFHLPEKQRVQTADFDLKFVVSPKFTDTDSNLRKANVRRLFIANKLFRCLQSVQPPSGYSKLYPRLTMLFNNVVHDVRIDGHRVYVTNPETGEERFTVYRFNKIFTIKLNYQLENQKKEHEFTLIDIGLFYRLPEQEPYYNFLSNTIYDTFLKKPFQKRIPIPYNVGENIRYPILPYILVDNFRMMLLANDFLHVYQDDQERIDFFKLKLKGYRRKLEMILREIDQRYASSKRSRSRQTPSKKEKRQSKFLNQIEENIQKTIKMYQPLARKNAICYREEGRFNFTTVLQSHLDECDQNYLDQLDQFFDQYYDTLKLIDRHLMK